MKANYLLLILLCIVVNGTYSQTSSLVYTGSSGRLVYTPYANWGQSNAVNTVPDFSYAGYMGGGIMLPAVKTAETVSPVAGDARGIIQAAIDRVSKLQPDAEGFRGAVLLKSGRYEVSGPLYIKSSGVVLRGEGQNTAGMGGTEIVDMLRTQHSFLHLAGSETAGTDKGEFVLDIKQYPVQYTWCSFNVITGVAEELEGDKIISFHLYTDANQYTSWASREDSIYKPYLELKLRNLKSGAETRVNIAAREDSYVRGGADSSKNFGTETSLAIKYSGENNNNTREGYLKFDLSSVQDSLISAKLYLYAKYDLGRTDVTVPILSHTLSYIKNDDWNELEITYVSRPRNTGGGAGSPARITTAYVPAGAVSFAVAGTSGLAAGDTIQVIRTPNDRWITDLNMAQYGWTAAYYRMEFERKIKAISGSTITIEIPVVQAMETLYGGGEIQKVSPRGRLSKCGVEDILFTSVYSGDEDEQHGWTAVRLYQTADCWVKNVTARYFGYSCVLLEFAYNTTVQDCAMLDPKSITTGSRKYSFYIDKGSFNLFQRCFTRGGRHDYVTGSQVAGPNVFADCAAVQTYADIGPHHRFSAGLLFDNIYGGEIRVQNRKDMGSGHGWAGAQTMFWNCQSNQGEFKVESPTGSMNWGIGGSGVLKLGAGYWEQYGLWVHPRSLYFSQLKDRLGLKAVENVTIPAQRQGKIWEQLLKWQGVGSFSPASGAEETGEKLPFSFRLDQNYPNPFNPDTKITFSIPEAAYVTLRAYNLLGEEVSKIISKNLHAGTHTIGFSSHKLPSGVYAYSLQAGGLSAVRKMMILK